jgi:hypothetical protein
MNLFCRYELGGDGNIPVETGLYVPRDDDNVPRRSNVMKQPSKTKYRSAGAECLILLRSFGVCSASQVCVV